MSRVPDVMAAAAESALVAMDVPEAAGTLHHVVREAFRAYDRAPLALRNGIKVVAGGAAVVAAVSFCFALIKLQERWLDDDDDEREL